MWPALILVIFAVALYWYRRNSTLFVSPPAKSRDTGENSPLLPGNGHYEMDIVGESHYQRHLEAVCDGPTRGGVHRQSSATLILERDNPYDKNAVAVLIDGGKVGHLSRHTATQFREWISKSEWNGREQFRCHAVIRGGWDRGDGDTGMYGVCLDVDLRTGPGAAP